MRPAASALSTVALSLVLSVGTLAQEVGKEPPAVTGVSSWVKADPKKGKGEKDQKPEKAEKGPAWDPDAKGEVDFARLKGKVVVLEFWATWCPPCRKSIPHLNELARAHERELVVLGLSAVDDRQDAGQVRKYAEEHVRYPVGVLADPATLERYGVSSIPHAVVIGKDGKVVWTGNPLDGAFEKAVKRAVESGGEGGPASRPTSRPSR